MLFLFPERENNCKEALSLWTRMQDSDITPSHKFVSNLCSLMRANNRDVPSELSLLMDKQVKVMN